MSFHNYKAWNFIEISCGTELQNRYIKLSVVSIFTDNTTIFSHICKQSQKCDNKNSNDKDKNKILFLNFKNVAWENKLKLKNFFKYFSYTIVYVFFAFLQMFLPRIATA